MQRSDLKGRGICEEANGKRDTDGDSVGGVILTF